jgi:hypothetical protein
MIPRNINDIPFRNASDASEHHCATWIFAEAFQSLRPFFEGCFAIDPLEEKIVCSQCDFQEVEHLRPETEYDALIPNKLANFMD